MWEAYHRLSQLSIHSQPGRWHVRRRAIHPLVKQYDRSCRTQPLILPIQPARAPGAPFWRSSRPGRASGRPTRPAGRDGGSVDRVSRPAQPGDRASRPTEPTHPCRGARDRDPADPVDRLTSAPTGAIEPTDRAPRSGRPSRRADTLCSCRCSRRGQLDRPTRPSRLHARVSGRCSVACEPSRRIRIALRRSTWIDRVDRPAGAVAADPSQRYEHAPLTDPPRSGSSRPAAPGRPGQLCRATRSPEQLDRAGRPPRQFLLRCSCAGARIRSPGSTRPARAPASCHSCSGPGRPARPGRRRRRR